MLKCQGREQLSYSSPQGITKVIIFCLSLSLHCPLSLSPSLFTLSNILIPPASLFPTLTHPPPLHMMIPGTLDQQHSHSSSLYPILTQVPPGTLDQLLDPHLLSLPGGSRRPPPSPPI